MRQSGTFVKKHAELLYDLVASVKEMYYAITCITNEPRIAISDYSGSKGVGKTVKGYAKVLSPYTRGDIQTGRITTVYRPERSEKIHFKVWSMNGERDDDIYEFPVEEIIAVYEQLEAIYKYEKSLAR